MNDADLKHLRRCVELAAEALEADDEPFGSVLVAGDGRVLAEDRNRVAGGDATRHPEFELARWAAANMTPDERAVLVLRHYVGYSPTEIGELLDLPSGTVRSRLHHAHRAMRAALDADARPSVGRTSA